MALDYRSVKDIYDTLYDSGATTQSLPEWSDQMNKLTETDLYSAGLHDNIIKRASVGLDKLIEATGVPGLGGEIGKGVGELVGAPEAGERIGKGTARMGLNFAPLLIPGVGWGATALRLGGTAALSGAQTYTETGSPAAGLLSGATAAVLPKVADIAEQAVLKRVGGRLVEGQLSDVEGNALDQVRRYFPESVPQRIAGAVGGQAGAAGLFGASGAGQELLAGEKPSSPFSVENLLSLTLGQAPFALIHLGGRAVGLGKTPTQRADILQHAVDVSTPLIEARQAKTTLDEQTPVERIPEVEQPPTISPKVLAETKLRLSQIRGEQVAIKDDPSLTPEDKLQKTNELLQQESDALKLQQIPTGNTIFGNSILPETPRQEVLGKQLRTNKNGTWRAVQISDDPSNPEELRGKIVTYSTAHEPPPTFGFQTQETGLARFSLPDAQWRTVKSQEEWDSKFPKKVVGEQTPELPIQERPATDEQIRAHLVSLEKVETETKVAQTPADLQQAVVHLNDVQGENDLAPTNDVVLRRSAETLVKSGLVDPQDAVKTALVAETKRTAQKLTQRESERAVPPLNEEQAAEITARMGGAGFSIITADKLSHATSDEFDSKPLNDIVTDSAMATARSQKAQTAFNGWEGRGDTTYAKDFNDFVDLVENYGSLSKVDPESAAKLLNERFGTTTWDKGEVSDFIQRPHVQEWATELNQRLVQQQQVNAVPTPALINIAGRKGQLLQNEDVGRVVGDFSRGHDVVDAFGGAAQLSEYAKSFGAKSITTNIKNPEMFALFDEIKNNTEDFASRVEKAVAPITSTREQSVPTVEGYDNVKTYLNQLGKTDPNVALYLKQNLNAMGREVVGSSFTPTKVMATEGLRSLPNRIRSYSRIIDNVSNEDGWELVKNAQSGDKILVDPPYAGTKKGMYADTGNITTETQLQNYEKYLYPAAERGAQFVVFDVADPQLIASLKEHGFTVDEASRTSRSGARVQPELIAHNDPNITPTPAPVLRSESPTYVPETPEDVVTTNKLGIPTGGRGMLNFLLQHPNPFYNALAKDLSKFSDSLDRITGTLRDMNGGAFTKGIGSGRFELSFSPGILRADNGYQAFVVAHELVHGLSRAELANPTNESVVRNLDDLRQRLIDSLPTKQKQALNDAIKNDWYAKYARGEVGNVDSLFPNGTPSERMVSYGLLNNEEMLSQGLTSADMRRFMQSVKVGNQTWFSRFTNTVKQLLGIGEKISNSAFEEFLSHTDQLMQQGDYVASFRNFANRYFENLGQSDQFVRFNTQRALGLVSSSTFGTSPEELLMNLQFGAGGVRSPEWSAARRDVIKMFNDRGDDFVVTSSVLDELGQIPDLTGLHSFATDTMLGEVTNHQDVIDLLPEPAIRYVFETARDAQQILGVLRAGTLEGNKGVLNIVDPELLRGSVKKATNLVDKVLASQKIHDQQIRDIQGLMSVPPDGFFDKMLSDPTASPEWAVGAKKEKDNWVRNFLEPMGQLARRVPEAAEALAKGWQLNANSRKMASESLKAFGTNLETLELTSDSVKATERTLSNPRMERAINQWIYLNQVEGKKANAVTMLDADHPEVTKILDTLNPKDRDAIEEVMSKHAISQQHMQSQMLEKMLQIASTNGGVVAQRSVGGKLKDSMTLSETLLRALTADRTDPATTQQAEAQISLVQQRMSPEGFLDLLKYGQGEAQKWQLWQKFFSDNPAWSSGQRYGKFLLEYKRGGRTFLAGVESRKEAETVAEGGKITKFEANRKAEGDMPPTLGPDSVGVITRLRELEDNQINMLRNYFTPDDIEQMRATSPVEQFATEEAYRGGVPGLTPPPRGLTKGAEALPWLSNHFSWVQKTATYWSRQLLRAQARAHLLDPEIAQNPDLQNKLQTHYDNILHPDTTFGAKTQRAVMTWFMGFNPASAMINATQPFLTHTAELTSLTGKPIDSYARVVRALSEVAQGGLKGTWKTPEHEWLIHQASQDGELDYSMFDDQAAAQESIATNYKRVLAGNRPQTLGQRLSTLSGAYSSTSMWMFRGVERINNMAALLSSFDYYRESQPNLSRDEVYAKAVEFNHAVNYGGGRAQRPIGAFAGRGVFPRTAAMLATSMQSYNLGTTFQIARYIRAGYFRPAGLTPHEVYAARKAGLQMMGTQLVAAGVLGLPFVSGAIALLDKTFPDLEVNRHLRETMAALLGGDKDNGNILGDIAMTGAPSMLGWDLQSRLSMGNTVPGVSEINGFDPELLLGAPANLVSTFVKGGQKLVQGDPHAIDSFMPSALKKIEQLLRSGGQVLDYRDRPIFQPSLGERAGIYLGFQPKRLSDYNAAQRILQQSQTNITRREGQFNQQQAEEVLKGNFGTVRQALLSRAQDDKTYNPRDAVGSIARAAEELTFPRDLRQEGTQRASDVRSRLLSTFNVPPTQPSEVDRLRFRTQIEQRLGLMVSSSTDLRTAQVIDALRRQNPEATRADLRRQAALLSRGPRLQTLASPEE